MAARIPQSSFWGTPSRCFLIRARRADIRRPYGMWAYPLPAVVSLVGYSYVFLSLGVSFILFGVGTLLLGALVYLVIARRQREWPFGGGAS